MNVWLRNFFQSDELPPLDVVKSTYVSACKVLHNKEKFPNADYPTLTRLVEEMEADPEICNII